MTETLRIGMSPDVIDALVPKRRGDEPSPRVRKGIFVSQAAEDGQSRVTKATIASATRLPLLVSSRPGSRSCSPVPNVVEGGYEKSSDDPPAKRPFLTMASQKARETFNHECIRSCALFADRDPVFVQQLMQDFHIQLFVDGDTIVNEGDTGDTMYFIRRGEVEVCIGEQQNVVRTLTDGSIFGELSLLGVSQKRTATVRATSFCDCRVISHRRFKQILHGFPKEHAFFTQLAADRRHELHSAKREKKRELHQGKIKEVAEVAQRRKTHCAIANAVSKKSLVISAFFPSSSEPNTRRSSWVDMTFDTEAENSNDASTRSPSMSCSRPGSPCSSRSSHDFCLSATWPLTAGKPPDCQVPQRPTGPKAAQHCRAYSIARVLMDSEDEAASKRVSLIPQAPPSSKPSRPSRKGRTFSAIAVEQGVQNTCNRGRSSAPKFNTDVLSEVANLYDMRRVFSPEKNQSPEPQFSRCPTK